MLNQNSRNCHLLTSPRFVIANDVLLIGIAITTNKFSM